LFHHKEHKDHKGKQGEDLIMLFFFFVSFVFFVVNFFAYPTLPVAGFAFGNTPPKSSCGRGITCTLMTSPTRPPAAAPASTAAFTAPTSPTRKAVPSPLPIFCQPTSVKLAAFTAASLASTSAVKPLVSIIPRASRFAAIQNSPVRGQESGVGSQESAVS